jgi:hypothetical protein
MNYPKYSVSDSIAGFSSLMHWGAILLAVVFGVAGLVCFFFSVIASIILIALASLLLIVQIISRARHMFKIRAVRPSGSSFYVFYRKTGQRFTPDDIRCICKKNFAYSDPWRPITIGYTGLEIQLVNVKEPVEHLYPSGLEDLRDKLFRYLKEYLSADVRYEE